MPPKFRPNIQWTLLKNNGLNLKNLYLRDYNPLRYGIPAQFQLKKKRDNTTKVLITPHLPHITMRNSVYSTPFSLAVTNSIAIAFFSSAY